MDRYSGPKGCLRIHRDVARGSLSTDTLPSFRAEALASFASGFTYAPTAITNPSPPLASRSCLRAVFPATFSDMGARHIGSMVLLLPLSLAACGSSDGDREIFSDVTAAVGLDFVHFNGMSGERYIVEIMAPGGALFDYDNGRPVSLDVHERHTSG